MKTIDSGFSSLIVLIVFAVLTFGGYYAYRQMTKPQTIVQHSVTLQQYAESLYVSLADGSTSETACGTLASQVKPTWNSTRTRAGYLVDHFYSVVKGRCLGLQVLPTNDDAEETEIVDLAISQPIVSCTAIEGAVVGKAPIVMNGIVQNSDVHYSDIQCGDGKTTWDEAREEALPPPYPLGPNTSLPTNTWNELKGLSESSDSQNAKGQ
jgi:hypothetical protein